MKKFSLFFLALSILTSFITQNFSEGGLMSRIALADIFGAIALITYMWANKFYSTPGYRAAFFILITFSIGLFQTEALGQTLAELLVLLFLMLISVTIYSVYRSQEGFIKLINLVVYLSLLTCFFGFYGLVASVTGLPTIFQGRATGEILSGFRNAGQAGAFVLIMLTILIPFRISKIFNLLNTKEKLLLNIAINSLIVFLFLTGKIAAYIGFAFCIAFSAMHKRRYGYVIIILIMSLFIGLIWSNLQYIAPDVYERINRKVESRITDNLNDENDLEDGFIAKNFGDAINCFIKHPITGSGIGGFNNVYSKYEVNSTYFKMIGETGILGTIAYIIFMLTLFRNFTNINRQKRYNPYADYLWNLKPFLLGCMVSWIYTYHLRKREFWIMFVVISIAAYLRKRFNEQQYENEQVFHSTQLPELIN